MINFISFIFQISTNINWSNKLNWLVGTKLGWRNIIQFIREKEEENKETGGCISMFHVDYYCRLSRRLIFWLKNRGRLIHKYWFCKLFKLFTNVSTNTLGSCFNQGKIINECLEHLVDRLFEWLFKVIN